MMLRLVVPQATGASLLRLIQSKGNTLIKNSVLLLLSYLCSVLSKLRLTWHIFHSRYLFQPLRNAPSQWVVLGGDQNNGRLYAVYEMNWTSSWLHCAFFCCIYPKRGSIFKVNWIGQANSDMLNPATVTVGVKRKPTVNRLFDLKTVNWTFYFSASWTRNAGESNFYNWQLYYRTFTLDAFIMFRIGEKPMEKSVN